MFKPVKSKADFAALEEQILGFWEERQIFQKSVKQREGAPLFILYEGPPTANASPGIHHVLSRVFKDVIPRYKTMKGYYAPRKAGWDTHGLPVELEVERELGFSSKPEIEAYGVAEFNARCRQSVLSYVKDWETLTKRIGFWVDMDHPYRTFDNGYIESCWWMIKQLWQKGLIYQGYKVTPHCPRCGTSLSSHEVALGYEEVEDPSVYIKFKVAKSLYTSPGFLGQLRNAYGDRVADFAEWLLNLVGDKPAYLLAWTTTPWTLPGNTALAVAADDEYSVMEGGDDYLIMASALVNRVGLEGYREGTRVTGSDLVDLRYEPLFNPFNFAVPVRRMDTWEERVEREETREPSADIKWKPGGFLNYPVIAADFVSMEDGTGIVHIAPAFGDVDFEAGKLNALDFVRDYVDSQGVVQGTYLFAGKFVKDADPLILDDLASRGLLYRSERIRHSYPFCWRCQTPLLYYAKPSWYIRTTAAKERLIAANTEINWYPEHIKYGRFGDWLENNVDWAFSRERYWGTPLPIWQCQACGEYECVGSVQELGNKPAVAPSLAEEIFSESKLDLHRPFVDSITFNCPRCGGIMHRVPEVIDCWFDSGAMPVAQWHYPFENKDAFNQSFPADYICEAVDQTRGWFYTLHALSVLLFEGPCFRNVICLGHILDSKGEKMSKSKGNVVDPWALLNSYGADALRWYLFTSCPPGNVRRFSAELVGQGVRKFLLTLWNTYSFFVTYANIDKFDPSSAADTKYRSDLDRWILSELNLLIDEVTRSLESYDPQGAGRRIEGFVDDISNWYVRRSRRRFWKSENDADKLAAYATLYQCLVTVAKLLAPLTPFIAEELYQNLVRSVDAEAPESVHLADFPEADLSLVDEQLADDTRLVIKVASLGRAARSKAGVKVRQPLAKVVVKVRSEREREGLRRLEYQVLDELNVKEMWFLPKAVAESVLEGYEVVTEGEYVVGVDRKLTPELADEGMAREIVHRLQTMRRSAGFDIADYIVTYYQGGASTKRVVAGFADYIKQETLSRTLIEGSPPGDAYAESHRIGDSEVMLAVTKRGS